MTSTNEPRPDRDQSLDALRAWHDDDAARVADLLDAHADPLWVAQFHSLHGLADGSWRRTLVAVDESGHMMGCASIAVNALHPTRFPCAIDVHPQSRRRGVGTALLRAIKRQRPHPAPLSTKVRTSNMAASEFIAKAGGITYQRSPGVTLNTQDPAVKRWARDHLDASCTNLVGQDPVALGSLFASQYAWVHERWSPVADIDLLLEVANKEISSIDPAVSAGVWRANQLVAVAFAFPTATGFEVVAETVTEHQSAGADLLAQAIAFVILGAGIDSCAVLEFDGHTTDPHLQPILASLPWHRSAPLDLVEIA